MYVFHATRFTIIRGLKNSEVVPSALVVLRAVLIGEEICNKAL